MQNMESEHFYHNEENNKLKQVNKCHNSLKHRQNEV